MANNKVTSLFNMSLPKPKRSNFNLGRVNRFSADVGWLIPCYVEEVLPNSYKRLDLEALIQTNATIAPLMGSFQAKFDAFFVPLRLYHRHLDLNNIRPNFSADFDFHYFEIPTKTNTDDYGAVYMPGYSIDRTAPSNSGIYATYQNKIVQDGTTRDFTLNMQVAPGSLIEYLGMLPAGLNVFSWVGIKKINATPFIGYFDIWRNYYSNPHDPQVPFRVQNYTDYLPGFNNPTYESGHVGYVDRYVSLDCFDKFIGYINQASYNVQTDVPRGLNIYEAFTQYFRLGQTSATYPLYLHRFNSPPLFAGQACGTCNVSGAVLESYDTRDGIHFGLLPRTYSDDYFNSRFMNSFVSFMEEKSTVLVEDNKFTVTQLRLQNRIAKYVDKSIFSDTRFGSWIKAHFGIKTNSKLNIPQFLGSISSNVVFNDIYASAQTGSGGITSNQALGSRASLGQGYVKNKGSFIEFQATEPGYIMVLFSLRPYVSYTQGIRKMYLKTSFNDTYKPEFDAVGYDDLQKLEMFAVGYHSNIYRYEELPISFDINDFNVSVGKQVSWIEYMTAVDESHGLMSKRFQYGAWVLNRPFAPNVYDEVQARVYDSNSNPTSYRSPEPDFDPSTYIRPEMFNTIFAVDKYTDNFQVQVRFYDKTKQPISKQILPHL